MAPTFSIIIPIYNAENYIQKCILSIKNQNYYDYEVIIINDGSTDNSVSKCKNAIKSDYRFKIFSKKNEGASSARNYGLERACGEYITFVDADDFLAPDYLKSFWEVIKNYETELIIQGGKVFHNNNNIKSISYCKKNTNLRTSEAIIQGNLLFHGFTWGKAYKRQIIDTYRIRFNESIPYKEDTDFLISYTINIKKITLIPQQGYNYILHSGSLSQKQYSFRDLLRINSIVNNKIQLLTSSNISLDTYVQRFIVATFWECLDSIYQNSYSRKIRIHNLIKLNNLYRKIISHKIGRYKADIITLFLLSHSMYNLFDTIYFYINKLRAKNV